VWAVKTLRPYVERKPFKVRTDHCALRWLHGSAADGNSRIERWRLNLAIYDFEVLYRPGVKNQAADATSRLLTSAAHPPEPIDEIPVLVVMVTEEEENDIETTPNDDAPLLVIPDRGPRVRVPDEGLTQISFDEIHEEQLDCPFVFQLWARMEKPQIRHLGLIEEDGLLHIRNMQGEDRRRLVAPISQRERILTLDHFPRVASHPGGRRLYRIVAQHWWWPALARYAALLVKRCVSCQASRAKRAATRTVPLCLFPLSGLMEFVSMDLLGPLPKTPRGNLHILVMTDRFSKLVVASALPDIRAITVSKAYIEAGLLTSDPLLSF
jgi:Integrase zinc binding domain/RNase H-like domain found in reverse transcriptase